MKCFSECRTSTMVHLNVFVSSLYDSLQYQITNVLLT